MADKTTYVPRQKKLFGDKYAAELKNDLKLENINQVPKLTKIVISSGVGRNKDNKYFQEVVSNTLTRINGQKTVARIVRKKSIASFKIRGGMGAPIGHSVDTAAIECMNSSIV